MDITLKRTNILMGDFHNMLINNDFCAIYYDIVTISGEKRNNGTVMEFVKFNDYGEKLGTRVVEGWGGTNDTSYSGMVNFQSNVEKTYEANEINKMLNYQFPPTTVLKDKYIVKYPSTYSEDYANTLIDIILNGFESWNTGITAYENWLDSNFDTNAVFCGLEKVNRTMSVYKQEIEELFNKNDIKKIYFDNILLHDKWAALHYRFTNTTSGKKTVGDRMEFLQFEKQGDNWKIISSFVK